MGARLYNPATGLFLSIDPIQGGNDNRYNYPNDPINRLDFDGRVKGGKQSSSAPQLSEAEKKALTKNRAGKWCFILWPSQKEIGHMTLRVSPWFWPLILAINTFTLIGVSGITQEGWGFFWCFLVVFGIGYSIFLAGGYVAVASSGRLYCIDFLHAFGKLWVEGADIEHWGLAMTTGAFFVSYSGQVTLKNGHVGQVKAVAGYSRRRVQRSLDRLVETVRSGSQ